jgi:ribosomal protein S6--L-glutamate ligase
MKLRVCILTYWGETSATEYIRDSLTQRNHETIVLSPLECSVCLSRGAPHVMSRGQVVEGVNAVLTRCVAYFHNGRLVNRNLEAIVATALMKQGAMAVNRPDSKLIASDKMASLALLASRGITVPPTVLVASPGEVDALAPTLGYPSVLKVTEGLRGAGVMRADSEAALRSVAEALLNLGHPLLFQPYLLTEQSRQLRVLVLGEDVLIAYETLPGHGDFRGNLHAGATATSVTVDSAIEDIAVASVRALNLDFAGVDLIVNGDAAYVIEVNPAPGFEFARRVPGTTVGGSLCGYLERMLELSRE